MRNNPNKFICNIKRPKQVTGNTYPIGGYVQNFVCFIVISGQENDFRKTCNAGLPTLRDLNTFKQRVTYCPGCAYSKIYIVLVRL